jgi:tRNA/tmRNA/rRNA uracil-C5-methylase (TrmA/RlmC/RlmD family)
MAEILRGYVLARALSYEPACIIDGYSGAGHTAVAFAEAGIEVTAIELDEDASNWSAARLREPSRAIRAQVEMHCQASCQPISSSRSRVPVSTRVTGLWKSG